MAEPAGGGVQAILDLAGEPIHALFDDCPICQALRDSGEPVFTIGASGELVPIDVSRSRRAD